METQQKSVKPAQSQHKNFRIHKWCQSGAFYVNLEQILSIALVLPML